jgi:hypothetical protein
LKKALAEEYGEEVEYENGYDEEALRPVECVSCSVVNSATNDLCKECGNPLNEQGEQLTKDQSTQPLEKKIGRIAEEEDLDQEELMEMFDKPFMDVVRELF